MTVIIEQDLTAEEYKSLRNTTNWTKLSDLQIETLIKNTPFKIRAKVDGKTVGMARAMFDFGYNAFLTDIVVDPNCQGMGVGRMLVENLIQIIKSNAVDNGFMQLNLLAAPGKNGFYEKLGFTRRDETTGYGMHMRFNQ